MDNGAYEKYRQENPVVNTPLSTYENVQIFVDHLTPVEQAVCAIAVVLAIYAVYKLIGKIRGKREPGDE